MYLIEKSYIFLLLVEIIPPSPSVEIILSLQNDQVATSPKDPTCLLFIDAPCACEQSSIIFKFFFLQIFLYLSCHTVILPNEHK